MAAVVDQLPKKARRVSNEVRDINRKYGVSGSPHDRHMTLGEAWTLRCKTRIWKPPLDPYQILAFVAHPENPDVKNFPWSKRGMNEADIKHEKSMHEEIIKDKGIPYKPGDKDSHLVWLGIDVVRKIDRSFKFSHDALTNYTKINTFLELLHEAFHAVDNRRARLDRVYDTMGKEPIPRYMRNYDDPSDRDILLSYWLDCRIALLELHEEVGKNREMEDAFDEQADENYERRPRRS